MLCYADMLSSPCLRAACLRHETTRTSRVAGIGLLVAWHERARFIVAAVVFVVTKQYNGGCHGLRCRVGRMHGGGGGVGMQGPRLRVLLLLSAYVPGDVALSHCDGVATHDLTHCAKGGRVARSLVARGEGECSRVAPSEGVLLYLGGGGRGRR